MITIRRLVAVAAGLTLLASAMGPLAYTDAHDATRLAPQARTAEPRPCHTAITRTVSATSVRECEPVTVSMTVKSECRACMAGLNVVFILPGYITSEYRLVGNGVIDQLEELRDESGMSISAAAIYHDSVGERILVPLTEELTRLRPTFTSPRYAFPGNWESAANMALRLLRAAAVKDAQRCDIIVFMGYVKDHDVPPWSEYRLEVLRAAQALRRDDSTLMAYCMGIGEMGCGIWRTIPASSRYYSERPDTRKIPQAVRTLGQELHADVPLGLKSLTLAEDVAAGLAYV